MSLPFAQGYDFSGLSARDYAQAILVTVSALVVIPTK